VAPEQVWKQELPYPACLKNISDISEFAVDITSSNRSTTHFAVDITFWINYAPHSAVYITSFSSSV